MKSLFILLKIVVAYTHPCIVFYTGGSNLISSNLYTDFLSQINDIDVYKIPFNYNKNIDIFFDNLREKYTSISLVGHSSGCVRAVNNCNNNIDNLILLDPVKTPFWNNKKNLNNLYQLIIINAEKSYKWSYIPPFVPFIPFFGVNLNDININKEKIKIITVKQFGHTDIINNPFRDIMHYSRISVGHKDRNKIKHYHKLLSKIITYHLSSKEIKSQIIV